MIKQIIMENYEILSLAIRFLTFGVVSIGLCLTIRQLRLNTRVFQQDHEWKRRDAATKIVHQINECKHNVKLNNEFKLSTNYTPLDLSVIKSKMNADLTIQNSIHKVLNDYEGIAVGINHGLYDEAVIKNLREHAMTSVYANFKNYIDERRLTHAPDAWNDYEILINNWKAAKLAPIVRSKTGK